jgi:hypothetical protein
VSVPLWVGELAGAFWASCGGPEPFPRTLRGPIADGPFDLTVKDLPGLSVRCVERYLADLGAGRPCGEPDRRLRACLAAWRGAGFIFLDAADPAEERTFSLAHELAHFLRDYHQPRERAATALGPGVRAVLDGARPVRPGERLHALLRGVAVGPHVHLMARDGCGALPAVAAAERAADRLAWELLAPAAEVRRRLGAGPAGAAALRDDFGLPAGVAAAYARELFPPEPRPEPLTARLKKARAAKRTG